MTELTLSLQPGAFGSLCQDNSGDDWQLNMKETCQRLSNIIMVCKDKTIEECTMSFATDEMAKDYQNLFRTLHDGCTRLGAGADIKNVRDRR